MAKFRINNEPVITIPEGVTEIFLDDFSGCDKLEKIVFENKKCKVLWSPEYSDHDLSLTPIQIASLYPMMEQQGFIKFVLTPEMWDKLSPEIRADIFLSRRSKAIRDLYHFARPAEIGEIIVKRLSEKPSSKNCEAAASFAAEYYTLMPKDLSEKLYIGLKSAKTGSKAISMLESDTAFMAFLNEKSAIPLSPVEQKVLDILMDQKTSSKIKGVGFNLKKYYGLDSNELPVVIDINGNTVSALVMSWLLTVHECWEPYGKTVGYCDEAYEKPGIYPELQEVVSLLDPESFQQALIKLAAEYRKWEQKYGSDLRYPICRYADDKTIEVLISGDMPFYPAVYSTTKAALLLVAKDKNYLHNYAKIRGIDEDTVRDQFIMLESETAFMAFLNEKSEIPPDPVEQKVLDILMDQKNSSQIQGVGFNLKKYYGLDSNELPVVTDCEGNTVSAMVLSWLLTVHEGWDPWGRWGGYCYEFYKKPGICPEAQEVVSLLDPESLQQALIKLAADYPVWKQKGSHLSYPICRYADEKTIKAVFSGGMPLDAVIYNTTKTAMLMAAKDDSLLIKYAELRGMDTDSIRAQIISGKGLDADRSKTYDLGNQIVKVRLQKDLSFTVELPDGKTAKSLPKKNADPIKYAIANKDFSELKKSIKSTIKNGINSLFADFLSGQAQNVERWKTSYPGDPLLRVIASLLVWQQGKNTFTLTESDVIDSAGNPYSLTNEDICLAYPAEMDTRDLAAWQEHFTANHLKQPFLQIWEPVRDLSKVESDRYKGIKIPYYRFMHMEKHGITFDASYDGQWIQYTTKGLRVNLEQLDYQKWWNHLEPNSIFEITEIEPIEDSNEKRYANHIIVYLDRITIRERIQKDDTQIIDFLPQFTAAQINEFISIASEANAVNVTAMLLEYKNTRYPDLDPLAEFTLDIL